MRSLTGLLAFDRLPRMRRRYRENQLVRVADKEKVGADASLCLNCGATVEHSYCTVCGQRDDDLRRPVWTFLMDFGDDILSWDSRFLYTLGPLLLLPGFLTRAYVAGKRARFVPPVRLYFIVSLFFFLVITVSDVAIIKVVIEQEAAATEAVPAPGATGPATGAPIDGGGVGGAETAGDDGTVADAAQEAKDHVAKIREEFRRELEEARAAADNELERVQIERVAKIGENALIVAQHSSGVDLHVEMFSPMGGEDVYQKLPDEFFRIEDVESDDAQAEVFLKNAARGLRIAMENPRRSNDLLNTWLPRAMFVLLPVFAILLRLFYWGRGRYFANQLVFSLHFHTYIFLVLTFLLVAQLVWGATVSSWMFMAAVPLYLFIALKITSGDGLIRTFFKFCLLSFFYAIILTTTVSAAVLYGLSQL